MSWPAAGLDILKAPGKCCGSCCSLLLSFTWLPQWNGIPNSHHFWTFGTLDGSNGPLALLPARRWTRWLPIYSQDRLQRSVPEPLGLWVSLPCGLPPSVPCFKIIITSSFPSQFSQFTIVCLGPSSLHHLPCFLQSPLNQAASGSSVVVVVTFDMLDALLLFADLFLSTDQPGSAKLPCLSASLPSYEA